MEHHGAAVTSIFRHSRALRCVAAASLLASAMSTTGCAMGEESSLSYPDGNEPLPGDAEPDALLQISVFPPDESDSFPVRLLSQTFSARLESTPTLVLVPPVRIGGIVTTYATNPTTGFAPPPGSDTPLAHAEITLIDDDGAVRSTVTDSEGAYELEVVPSGPFTLQARHDEPTVPPYREQLDISSPLDLDLDLDLGTAIYGHVFDDLGQPLEGAAVFAVDDADLQSGVAVTDDNGFYALQTTAGTWTVICAGRADGRDPVIEADPVAVDLWGASVDLAYASLEQVNVGGRVVDAEGAGLGGVTLHFVSVALDDYEGGPASVEIETLTNSSGNFDTRLVPGVYNVVVVPDDDHSALMLSNVTLQEDLPDIVLADFSTFSGTVRDAAGRPVPRAAVDLHELADGQRTWSTYTNDLGVFSMDVAEGDTEVTLSPPGDRTDLAMTRVRVDTGAGGEVDLTMEPGQPVSGSVSWLDQDELIPIAYAWVEIRDADGRLWGAAITDDEGYYAVRISDSAVQTP